MMGKLKFETVNVINYVVLFFSILIIAYVLMTKKLERNLHLFSCTVFCCVIFNALVLSNLSTIADRYQTRVVWLIPLLAIIFFYRFIYPSLKKIITNWTRAEG